MPGHFSWGFEGAIIPLVDLGGRRVDSWVCGVVGRGGERAGAGRGLTPGPTPRADELGGQWHHTILWPGALPGP